MPSASTSTPSYMVLRIVLTKADLTEDSDGNYKYVLRLDRFTDARPISVMGYFQKKESSGTTYLGITATVGILLAGIAGFACVAVYRVSECQND